MKVLLDYDNIPEAVRKPGLIYLADRLLRSLGPKVPIQSFTALDLRLYGGWDQNTAATKRAQDLNAEIGQSFPRFFNYVSGADSTRVRVNAQLARSLETLPKKPIQNTLRHLPFTKDLTCSSPSAVGCTNPKCPLDSTVQFINSKSCPVSSCGVSPSIMLKSYEQKLVDTMIVADMAHLAITKSPYMAVASSDDDIWPGIILAMQNGCHVIHVQTFGSARPSIYRTGVIGNYAEVSL